MCLIKSINLHQLQCNVFWLTSMYIICGVKCEFCDWTKLRRERPQFARLFDECNYNIKIPQRRDILIK